jgi:hypothetical protein
VRIARHSDGEHGRSCGDNDGATEGRDCYVGPFECAKQWFDGECLPCSRRLRQKHVRTRQYYIIEPSGWGGPFLHPHLRQSQSLQPWVIAGERARET